MTASQRRVLLLFAHPAIGRSRVNRALLEAARGLDTPPTVHDLYECYPDFDVDVEREKALLLEHDVVVCQHPLYWYSTPALVKQWFDLVLQHGWAYGSGGDALRGKTWVQAVTTGAPAAAYCSEGRNGHSIREFLAPVERTAGLCGMEYLPPFCVHGALGLDDEGLERGAREYAAALDGLRTGSFDPAQLANTACLNAAEGLRDGEEDGV